jgi:hypothetical protein
MPVSLSFFLALLLRILAGQEKFHYDPELGHGALTWFFGLISAFLLLHLLAGTARSRAKERSGNVDWVEPIWVLPLRSILPTLPLILYGLMLFPGGWLSWIDVSLEPQWQLTREFFALFPYFWFEILSLLGALRLHGTPRPSWLRLRRVLAVLPIWGGVWLVQDLLPFDGVARAMIDEIPLARPISMLLTVLLLLPFAPIWIRRLYKLGPLPHAEYATVLSAIAGGLGMRFSRYWALHEEPDSPGPLFLRGISREAMLSSREIEDYKGTELEVLFVSGLERIRRRMDLRLAVIGILLPVAFFSLFELGGSRDIPAALGLIVIGAFVFMLIGMLAYFSRRYILEADLATARRLGSRMCEESLASLIDRGEDPGPRLFEPALDERREVLQASRKSEGFRRFFGRANRYSELILVVLVLLTFGVTGGTWKTRWDQARPSYELSRGAISKAEQTLESQLARYRELRRKHEAAQAAKEGVIVTTAHAWDEGGYDWASYLRDLVSRARLLIHEDADEGDLALLRRRALSRARLALLRGQRASRSGEKVTGLEGKAERNASFEQAFAWLELARRWGRDRGPIEALQLGLISRVFEDSRGLRRSEYLLRRLDIPSELDDSVRIVLGP